MLTYEGALEQIVTLIERGGFNDESRGCGLYFNPPDAASLLRNLKEAAACLVELKRLRGVEERAVNVHKAAARILSDNPAVLFEPRALVDTLESVVDGVPRCAPQEVRDDRADACAAMLHGRFMAGKGPVFFALYIGPKA